jgi:hypothetical protein
MEEGKMEGKGGGIDRRGREEEVGEGGWGKCAGG